MSVGPYYCVYLRPNWKLLAKPANSEAETIGHPAFWRSLCQELVAQHYRLRDERLIERMSHHCYAMPRGRCSQLLSRRGKPQAIWTLYHGDDFPKAKSSNQWMVAVLAAFNLQEGQVELKFDEHETMQADDQLRIQQIIGPVPYSRKASI